jgi:hypothetical protein
MNRDALVIVTAVMQLVILALLIVNIRENFKTRRYMRRIETLNTLKPQPGETYEQYEERIAKASKL